MKLLDLFCGSGGAAKGYQLAGFDKIVCIDLENITNYPYQFIQEDALDYLWKSDLREYNLIHASPPCQAYSWSTRSDRKEKYQSLISKLRDILIEKRCEYVIENVQNSDLINPIILEGFMFGLPIKRRRLFECSFDCYQPKIVKGKVFVTVAGNGGNAISYSLTDYQLAMGIDWMDRKQICQAIPPKYTEYIANEFLSSYSQD